MPRKPAIKLSPDFAEKERLVKRLNERIASVVRKVGPGVEEVTRWSAKLTRANSRYKSRQATYKASGVKLSRNRGRTSEAAYTALSRRKEDIETMSLSDLKRLEEQTRGYGAIRKEAESELRKQKISEERYKKATQDYNPFVPDMEIPASNVAISDEEIQNYLQQKEAVREFLEARTDAFYALIEATDWDDIRDHTTKEIYQQISKLNMDEYRFTSTTGEIGKAYIARREASREHRRALGI